MNWLVHRGARPLESAHQDQRRQATEVPAGAGHALVKALMGVALPWRITGMGHGDCAVGDLPSLDSLLQRLLHCVLNRFEEGVRHRSQLDLEAEVDAGVNRGWIDPQPNGRQKRVAVSFHDLDRRSTTHWPFNADGPCLAECD